ncbi:response regulator transcription factor [Paenibacillus rigui]|uniref:DNA-binding response regulator n=1 Tax=Paenibacillus rigui TaxID=554312 RepID=A0A229URP5_9BACL|nr:response regulator [Paenibacillus rigui]OXM85993.1 DNA-binding response regulator [Paenibacillus rigui]
MKIMIVDDEVIIRTGLAKVIKWEELGLELLEPAESAEEALERLERERPNILLTDIRMTGKTGLQLAEEAKRLLPELEVIILSGYDDFSYAQQAIRYEVSDYLLKTSRPEDIIKAVLRAKQRVEEKWTAYSQDHFKQKEVVNRLFERWIVNGETGVVESGLLPAYFPRLLGDGHKKELWFQMMIVTAEGWDDSPVSGSLLHFAVENMLHDLMPCETLLEKKRIVIAFASSSGAEENSRQLRSFFQKIERLLKCKLFAALGQRVSRKEELHASFLTADAAFGYQALIPDSVCDYTDIVQRRGGKTVCTHEEELELSSILLENDPVALKGWVKRLVQEQLEDPQMTQESLEALIHSAAIAAHRWLARVLAATGRGQTAEEGAVAGHLQLKQSVQPKDALFQRLYSIMKLYHHQLAEGQATHAQKAMAYIEEHLGQDVGLQQVAKHVHLHPNHLSEVFKKETGMTFGDYVTRQKIRRAMEILTVSPAKVSEVAAKVGYEDVKYFGQLFKKYTGKTPSEFREEAAQHTGQTSP